MGSRKALSVQRQKMAIFFISQLEKACKWPEKGMETIYEVKISYNYENRKDNSMLP